MAENSQVSQESEAQSIPITGTFKLKLPKSIEGFLLKVSGLTLFAFRNIKEVFKPPYEFTETVKQMYAIGYKSLPLVAITGIIIGFTLSLQSIPTLEKFGAASLVPSMVALAVILEIGPVITSLIFAGKIGSGIGAELGSMKVTEQIDAMEVSGCNPFKYLVVTRVTAATFMLPILVILSDAMSLFGGFIALNLTNQMSLKLFLMNSFTNIDLNQMLTSTFKTVVFGFSIGVVGCYEGYNADRGTESVGIAANTAVVIASLLVILIDMVMVQLTSIIF